MQVLVIHQRLPAWRDVTEAYILLSQGITLATVVSNTAVKNRNLKIIDGNSMPCLSSSSHVTMLRDLESKRGRWKHLLEKISDSSGYAYQGVLCETREPTNPEPGWSSVHFAT